MMHRPDNRQSGFTLLEAVVVMVVIGILSAGIAVFMTRPIEGYVDAVRRAELTDQADVALRRMARDIRLALPNSLRLKDSSNATVTSCSAGTDCAIEFIMTKSGGRYRDTSDGSTGGNFLDYSGSITTNTDCAAAPALCFDVLGTDPTHPPNIATGDSLVVYNLGPGYSPGDAYVDAAPGGNRTTVTVTPGTPYRLDMASNVFAAQSPPLPSPDARFQIVGQNDRVVRFACTGSQVRRQSNCDFAPDTTSCGTTAVLAGGGDVQATCELDYQATALGRTGTLYVRLILTHTASGESVTLFQQVHVDNAP
jgi:MSHA biogenesis protein MshO